MEFWPQGFLILLVVYFVQFIVGFILVMNNEIKTRRGFILTFTPFLFIPLVVIFVFRIPVILFKELKRKWDDLPVEKEDD